jgi:hypothetical protein
MAIASASARISNDEKHAAAFEIAGLAFIIAVPVNPLG